LQNVQKELSRLQEVSKSAFEGANKAINKSTLLNGIRDSLSNLSDTVYETMTKEQQTAYSENGFRIL